MAGLFWGCAGLLSLAAASLVISRRLTGDFLCPAALLIAAWSVALGLYLLRLLPYIWVGEKTLLVILGALSLFSLGAVAGARVRVRPRGEKGALDSETAARWILFYSLLGLLGVLWYALAVTLALGWSSWTFPARIRWAMTDRTLPGSFYWLVYFCIAAPLLAIVCRVSGTRLKRIILLPSVLCALALWPTTDRNLFFMLVLAATWIVLYRFPQLRLMRYLGILALSALLLALNFSILGWWVGKTPKNLGVQLALQGNFPEVAVSSVTPSKAAGVVKPLPPALQKLSTIYVYATGAFPALARTLAQEPDYSMGERTLFPVLRFLQRVGLIHGALPPAIDEFTLISEEGSPVELRVNSYTFLRPFFEDFGVPGALLLPLLLGLLTGVVYEHLRRNRSSPVALALIGQIGMALSLSTFTNKFSDTGTWYVAVLLLLPFSVGLAAPGRRLARAG